MQAPHIRRVARAAVNRALLSSLLVRCGQGLCIGVAVGAVGVVIERALGERVPLLLGTTLVWPWIMGAGAALGIMGGVAAAVIGRWNLARAALELDTRLGLHDRLSSAWSIASRGASHAIDTLVLRAGEAAAQGVDPRKAVQIEAGRGWVLALPPALLGVAAGLWMPALIHQGQSDPSTAGLTPAALEAAKAEVASLTEEATRIVADAPPDPSVERELRELEAIERELASGVGKDASTPVKAAEAAGKLAAALDRSASEELRRSDEARSALARAASIRTPSEDGDGSPEAQLREHLQKGDIEAAATALEELARTAPDLSQEDRARWANELSSLARAMRNGAEPVSKTSPPSSEAGERGALEGAPERSSRPISTDAAIDAGQSRPQSASRDTARPDEADPPRSTSPDAPDASPKPVEPPSPSNPDRPKPTTSKSPGTKDAPTTSGERDQAKETDPQRQGSQGPRSGEIQGQGAKPENPRTPDASTQGQPQQGKGREGDAAKSSVSQDQPGAQQDATTSATETDRLADSLDRAAQQLRGQKLEPQPSPRQNANPSTSRSQEEGQPQQRPNAEKSDQGPAAPSPRNADQPTSPPTASDGAQAPDGAPPPSPPPVPSERQPGDATPAPGPTPPQPQGAPGEGPMPIGQPSPNPTQATPREQDAQQAPSQGSPSQPRGDGASKQGGGNAPSDQKPPADSQPAPRQGEPGAEPPRGDPTPPSSGSGTSSPPMSNSPSDSPSGSNSPSQRPGSPSNTPNAAPSTQPPRAPASGSPQSTPRPGQTGDAGRDAIPPLPKSEEAIKDLAKQLADVAEQSRRGQQQARDAQQLRERSQRLLEEASPQERQQLERLAREFQRELASRGQDEQDRGEQDPGEQDRGQQGQQGQPGQPQRAANQPSPEAGGGASSRRGDGSAIGGAGQGRGPVSAPRRGLPPSATEAVDARGRDRGDRVIAEWLGEGAAGSGTSPALEAAVRDAASGVERSIEQQTVPPEYQDLVRRVFRRYTQSATSPSPSNAAASPAQSPAPTPPPPPPAQPR